ncbi:MAG: DUF4132 domain-containing protein [Sphingobacteriales bacterium]|nr:MAG: DUF4132 domain-containing protein [Sphingobacteriales bacterium]
MGWSDNIKKLFRSGSESGPQNAAFDSIIEKTREELAATESQSWSVTLNDSQTWNEEVKKWSDKMKIDFITYLIRSIQQYERSRPESQYEAIPARHHRIRETFLQALFRNKLVMDDDDVVVLYNNFRDHPIYQHSGLSFWPIGLMINQLVKQRPGETLSPALQKTLEEMKGILQGVDKSYQDKESCKIILKIEDLLAQKTGGAAIKSAHFIGDDQFAAFANTYISNLPEDEKSSWYTLLPIFQKASGSKPTKKFSEDTKAVIARMGELKFITVSEHWLDFLINMQEVQEVHTSSYAGQTHSYTTFEFLTPINTEAIKGFIWATGQRGDSQILRHIGKLADRSFRKIPGKGPASVGVGNACLFVLSSYYGMQGIGQLSRLKLRIKQASTQSQIDKYLMEAARLHGVSVHEIEDMAVEDFGLTNGSLSVSIGDITAVVTVVKTGKTSLQWLRKDGTEQKTVPAIVKEVHARELKELKETTKQLEQTLVAQRDRIDRLFRTARNMSWSHFENFYIRHRLMSWLADRIIWNLHTDSTVRTAMRKEGKWVESDNKVVDTRNVDSVSLWHPVQATIVDIKAWREFLVANEILQPVKQAFREVYLLTPAEINTVTYSNRMAAHVLKQHQFNSLAKARGWRYTLMGAFDNGVMNETASLSIPEYNLKAEYWIFEVTIDDAFNDTGIWNYVSTDQIRFVDTRTEQDVNLIDVPPVVFSEVMRDADLFVGVASIGNDPSWQDAGGTPVHRDYWQSYSFGELGELAKNRKEILMNLLPRIKIRDVATIRDKFLIVSGKLRTYKIHIGSTNILMEPNDQYLCIVPDRSPKNYTEKLFLPFEGDNGLSIILSKAFLLADDDKITDSSILVQINAS